MQETLPPWKLSAVNSLDSSPPTIRILEDHQVTSLIGGNVTETWSCYVMFLSAGDATGVSWHEPIMNRRNPEANKATCSPNAIMMFDATGTVVNGLCTIHGHHHSSLPSCWDRRLADACHRNLREAPAQPIPLAPPLSRHDYIPEIVYIYIYHIYISYIYIK